MLKDFVVLKLKKRRTLFIKIFQEDGGTPYAAKKALNFLFLHRKDCVINRETITYLFVYSLTS